MLIYMVFPFGSFTIEYFVLHSGIPFCEFSMLLKITFQYIYLVTHFVVYLIEHLMI